MNMDINKVVLLAGFYLISYVVLGRTSELVTIHGQLVRVIDNCTVGKDDTCPAGQCCTKDGLAYIPEYTGQRAAYALECRPYRQRGESCYHYDGICPCDPSASLNCVKGTGFLGRCQ